MWREQLLRRLLRQLRKLRRKRNLGDPRRGGIVESICPAGLLPVARRWDSEEPMYLEDGAEKAAANGELLKALCIKGLISLDYDMPLSGFDYAAYEGYPCRGSMALTAEGQRVIEQLEIQGVEE